MNDETIQGAFNSGAGKAESFAGNVLGDDSLKAEGEARQFKGRAQDAVGSVHEAIDKVAGSAKAAASTVNARASDAYDKVSRTAEDLVSQVNPLVEEQPYLAVALAAAAGLLAGLLIAARGPRVIYVKSRA
jgi:ElaB/YqjD/DUF883 family membrane-anchored ribosome-binding protein